MFPVMLALPQTESVESVGPRKRPSASINSVLCDCYLLFNIEPRPEAGKQALSHRAVPSPSVAPILLQASHGLACSEPPVGQDVGRTSKEEVQGNRTVPSWQEDGAVPGAR